MYKFTSLLFFLFTLWVSVQPVTLDTTFNPVDIAQSVNRTLNNKEILETKVEIKNSLGQTLISMTNFDLDTSLNLEKYVDGMYFMEITHTQQTTIIRILKQ